MKKVPAIKVYEAIDTLDDAEFTKQEIVMLSDASLSGCTMLFRKLIDKGLLTDLGGIPIKYRRAGGSLVEAFNNGEIKHGRQPREPAEEMIEIDPIEIFESMDADDFGKLVALYVKKKNAVLDPLREQITFLGSEADRVRSEYTKAEARHDMTVKTLREELRVEREKVMELRITLSKERESRAIHEAPVKTIVIRGDGNAHAQSGGTGIPSGALSRVVVHRKGRMDHVPKGARRRN